MTPNQALNNIKLVCNGYKWTLEEHKALIESINLIEAILFPANQEQPQVPEEIKTIENAETP